MGNLGCISLQKILGTGYEGPSSLSPQTARHKHILRIYVSGDCICRVYGPEPHYISLLFYRRICLKLAVLYRDSLKIPHIKFVYLS